MERLDSNAEEILETLWVKSVEEGLTAVPIHSFKIDEDDPSLRSLIELRFVSLQNGKVKLERAGYGEAQNTVRRHRLAERLLVDVLDVKGELIEESACKFEHLLHKGIDDRICTLLGHPKFCPHDKPIPPGHCCQEARDSGEKLVSPLTGLKPGQAGRIAYLHAEDFKKIQKLMAMGVLPGASIELTRRFPSFVFKVGYSQFAVDEEMAKDIYVRLTEGKKGSFRTPGKRRRGMHRHQGGKL